MLVSVRLSTFSGVKLHYCAFYPATSDYSHLYVLLFEHLRSPKRKEVGMNKIKQTVKTSYHFPVRFS